MRISENNVVIFTWNIPRGGLTKVILKEYNYFKERKIFPTILTFEYPQEIYGEELLKTKLKILNLNERKNTDISIFFPGFNISVKGGLLNNMILLNSYLRKENPSVIISHQLLSAILVIPYCLIYRKSYVLILHDNPFLFLEKNSYGKANIFRSFILGLVYLVSNFVIYKSKQTICTTPQIYDVINKKLFFRKDRKNITIAEYGIDPSKESALVKRKLLLTVSKWSKFRNPQAYAELLNFLPQNINLTMVGRWDSDTELNEFIDFVNKNGLSNRIKIMVNVSEEELSNLYDETRVFLRLGFGEKGTGQAILEALSHGCPVVISKDLGASSIIEDGKQGFLVDENDLSGVANKISIIFKDDNILQSMVKESYDLSKRKNWNSYLEVVFKAAIDLY